MEKGGFTYVGRKGGAEHSRRRRATHKTRDARLRSTPPLDESAKADDGQANPPQLAVLHERVERAVAELRPSDILARLLDAIRSAPATEPARLLSCFGIGSFALMFFGRNNTMGSAHTFHQCCFVQWLDGVHVEQVH